MVKIQSYLLFLNLVSLLDFCAHVIFVLFKYKYYFLGKLVLHVKKREVVLWCFK